MGFHDMRRVVRLAKVISLPALMKRWEMPFYEIESFVNDGILRLYQVKDKRFCQARQKDKEAYRLEMPIDFIDNALCTSGHFNAEWGNYGYFGPLVFNCDEVEELETHFPSLQTSSEIIISKPGTLSITPLQKAIMERAARSSGESMDLVAVLFGAINALRYRVGVLEGQASKIKTPKSSLTSIDRGRWKETLETICAAYAMLIPSGEKIKRADFEATLASLACDTQPVHVEAVTLAWDRFPQDLKFPPGRPGKKEPDE